MSERKKPITTTLRRRPELSRIESLTPEQVAKFPAYVEKWLKVGLSTAPCDRAKAEASIVASYRVANISWPKDILWVESPLGCVCAVILLKNLRASVGASVGASVRASVWDSVGASVRASVGASVWDSVGNSVEASVEDSVEASVEASVWDSVRASVGDSVRASVEASVRASVRASVEASVRASVGAPVRAAVGDSVGDSVRNSVGASVWDSVRDSVWASVGGGFCYGSHDASWLAFYEFFLNELDLKCCEKLAPMMHTAMHCGWWLPYENMVIASEKPSGIHLLGARIHRDGGPAVLYRDGFSVWALNGVRVSQGIAETPADRLDAKLVLSEKNAEVRREIVRKIGVHRVVTTLGGKELETWGNYSLISLDLGDGRHRP